MSAPWMPLYVADYLADTAHLTAAEHGAYLLMIMHYWRAGKLPNDERQLQRIARMTAREWSNSRDTLAALFGDCWSHKRIENELAKSELKSTARAEAGSRGGKAKSLKINDAGLANATVLPEQKAAVALASSSQSQPEDKDTSLRSVSGASTCEAPILEKPKKPKAKVEPELGDIEIIEALSPWLDRETASALLDSRKRLKCQHTPFAVKLLCKDLAKCRDPTAQAHKAILSKWKTVYPEKDDERSNGAGSGANSPYGSSASGNRRGTGGVVEAASRVIARMS